LIEWIVELAAASRRRRTTASTSGSSGIAYSFRVGVSI
jgi:hypothetical protein